MLDALFQEYRQRLANHQEPYRRYLHRRIDRQEKMIGIIGPRGVGKTTLMFQHLSGVPDFLKSTLYVNMDSLLAAPHTLYDIADGFQKVDGKVLAIDEIHRYPEFQKELKAIYDAFDLQVLFSGSSALAIEHSRGDLSRRAVIHRMQGLSFREYLELESDHSFELLSLQEILQNHEQLTFDMLKIIKPLGHFQTYLKQGYYPYYRESIQNYPIKLKETTALSIEADLAQIYRIDAAKVHAIKKMLVLLCESAPAKLNIAKLSTAIGANRNTVYTYLEHLEKASLIKMVHASGRGYSKMSKPEKLYLDNTNLQHILCKTPDVGTMRELFIVNQLSLDHQVEHSESGDFLVDDEITLEVGGKGKDFSQIKDKPNAYVVADDIETGFGNKIPLWLFGFLY